MDAEEGRQLPAGKLVAQIDTTQLHLQRKQIEATIGTLPKKLRNAIDDIKVLEYQKANLIRERDRVSRLVAQKAATPKQLDDMNGEMEVIDQQIVAIRSQAQTANRGILAEKEPLLAQVDVIREQIRRCYVYNPVAGTVLTRLMEPSEMVSPGTPLYRIGQLDTMTLRAYASSTLLQNVRIGQPVEVLIDDGKEGLASLSGRLSWISDQAEFTPKVIQTKQERTNLVYALKVEVPNPDGRLKIGMPAEVNFTPRSSN
jgi:HlyD family secretion protein